MRFLQHSSNHPKPSLTRIRRYPALGILVLVFLVLCPDASLHALSSSAAAACVTNAPPSRAYTVKICLSSPISGATLSGNASVTATVTVTGSAPGVQRVMFYLDGTYLLTDYQGNYTFSIRTAQWVDGTHTIAANAMLRDRFASQRVLIPVTFKNGVKSPPVNKNQFHPTGGRSSVNGSPFVVAAGGDGASGEANATKVVNLIVSKNPNLFLYLGDVYERGSITEFYNWYGTSSSSFGRLRSITNPTVGNHEYLTPKAAGYFNYWNNVPNYYSFNTHGWHFISLNSNSSFTPTGPGSAQYIWLQRDLVSLPPQMCTIVYYHHPLFNIGSEQPAANMSATWKLMASHHVDIVLNGHDHDYQRWFPLDGNGNRSPGGIVEFVVGNSGHGLQEFSRSDARVAYKNNSNPAAFGALFLQLTGTGANFSYLNSAGVKLDSGMIPCKPMVSISPVGSQRFIYSHQ
jgi:hypothetical protein